VASRLREAGTMEAHASAEHAPTQPNKLNQANITSTIKHYASLQLALVRATHLFTYKTPQSVTQSALRHFHS